MSWFRRKATVVFSLLIKEKISVFINIAATQSWGQKTYHLSLVAHDEICLIMARAKTLSNKNKEVRQIGLDGFVRD